MKPVVVKSHEELKEKLKEIHEMFPLGSRKVEPKYRKFILDGRSVIIEAKKEGVEVYFYPYAEDKIAAGSLNKVFKALKQLL